MIINKIKIKIDTDIIKINNKKSYDTIILVLILINFLYTTVNLKLLLQILTLFYHNFIKF